MGVATAIGLGLTAASTAVSVYGNVKQGEAAQAGANAQAELAALDNEKSLLNAVMAMYEADRLRDEANLDLDYIRFSTERQAQWLKMISEYDQSMTTSKAAASAKNAAISALSKGQAVVDAAQSESGALLARGAAQAASLGVQTRFKAVMQATEDSQAMGARRAALGTRSVSSSGSALDVLEHEQAMSDLRQQAIAITGGMQLDDIRADASTSASLRLQGAYRQASDLMGGTLGSIEEQNLNVASALARAKVESAREVALVEEEGWRTAMKLKMGSDNTIAKTLMGASNQVLQGAASLGQAASYRAAGQASADASMVRAGSSLLSGASKMMDMYADYNKPLTGKT